MPCRSFPRALAVALLVTRTLALSASAQSPTPEEREVVATVQTFFNAMATCDADRARAISMPEGRLYRLTPGAADPPRSDSFEQFSVSLGKCGRKLLERMWAPQVRVHKGLATLWAPYDFWIDGAFSHCGIDSFQLVKTAEGWKLTGGLYTVERDGCGPSPLGAPTFK